MNTGQSASDWREISESNNEPSRLDDGNYAENANQSFREQDQEDDYGNEDANIFDATKIPEDYQN
jgi:hypothetical protein